MPLPITAIILTHHAQPSVARAIASVDWASEIMVIDYSGSDEVASLVNREKSTVLRQPPIPIVDFAAARNQAMAVATQPWVFFLDSDEELAATAPTVIRQALEKNSISAWSIPRVDVFQGKELHWGECYHSKVTRLLKKDSVHFERQVHEEPCVNGKVGVLATEIFHYSHPNISEFFTSVASYAKIAAKPKRHQSKLRLIAELATFPLGKFLFNMVFKSGWRDGWRGLIYAAMMSLHSAFVRIFAWELQHD